MEALKLYSFMFLTAICSSLSIVGISFVMLFMGWAGDEENVLDFKKFEVTISKYRVKLSFKR